MAGIVGVFTASKDGKFSINQNQRWPNDGVKGLLENIVLMHTGAKQASWGVRESLEKCDDFACAVKYNSEVILMAPLYLIIAGVKDNEGVVMTRDRFDVANLR